MEKATQKTTQKSSQKTVEKTVEKILGLIKSNPNITQKELAEITGLTRRGVEWNLKKLKDMGTIKRIGPDKGGHWQLVEKQATNTKIKNHERK